MSNKYYFVITKLVLLVNFTSLAVVLVLNYEEFRIKSLYFRIASILNKNIFRQSFFMKYIILQYLF